MRTRPWLALVALAILAPVAMVWAAEAKKEGELTLDNLPAPVKATVLKEAPGAKVQAIARETQDGKTVYAIVLEENGKEVELRVDSEGKLLGQDVRMGGTVSIEKVPPPVKATILKEAGGGKIEQIIPLPMEGKMLYLVDVTGKDKGLSLRVAADGTLVGKEIHEQITIEQTPAPVKAVVQKEAEGLKIEVVVRLTVDNKTMYMVQLTGQNRSGELIVEPDGKLVSKQSQETLTLEQAPPAIKATLQKEAEGLKLDTLERIAAGGTIIYQAAFSAEGKTLSLELDADGKVVGKESEEKLTLEQVPAPVKAAILKEAKGGKVTEILRTTVEKEVTYDVLLTVDGKEVNIQLDPHGKLLTGEEEQNPNEPKERQN